MTSPATRTSPSDKIQTVAVAQKLPMFFSLAQQSDLGAQRRARIADPPLSPTSRPPPPDQLIQYAIAINTVATPRVWIIPRTASLTSVSLSLECGGELLSKFPLDRFHSSL